MLSMAFVSNSAAIPPLLAISRSCTAKNVGIPEVKTYQFQKRQIHNKIGDSSFESQNHHVYNSCQFVLLNLIDAEISERALIKLTSSFFSTCTISTTSSLPSLSLPVFQAWLPSSRRAKNFDVLIITATLFLNLSIADRYWKNEQVSSYPDRGKISVNHKWKWLCQYADHPTKVWKLVSMNTMVLLWGGGDALYSTHSDAQSHTINPMK